MLKRLAAALLVLGMSFAAQPAFAAEFHHTGISADTATVPTLVSPGDTDQILPKQDSVYAPFRHGFTYKISNPKVLSVEADGTWKALGRGTTTLTVVPVDPDTATPEFEKEM